MTLTSSDSSSVATRSLPHGDKRDYQMIAVLQYA